MTAAGTLALPPVPPLPPSSAALGRFCVSPRTLRGGGNDICLLELLRVTKLAGCYMLQSGPNNPHSLVRLRMCPCKRCPHQGDTQSAVIQGAYSKGPSAREPCKLASRAVLSSRSLPVWCHTCWCCRWSPGAEHRQDHLGVSLIFVAFHGRIRRRDSRKNMEAAGRWGHLGCPTTSVLGGTWGRLSCQPSCRPSHLAQMRFPDCWTSPNSFLSRSPIYAPQHETRFHGHERMPAARGTCWWLSLLSGRWASVALGVL